MAWTATNPTNIGGDTKRSDWDALWDNCDFIYIPATTVEFFGQSSAPTGWTKKTDWADNNMLIYTTGNISSGGSDDPTSGFTTAISVNNESSHTHSMQSHTHTLTAGAIIEQSIPPPTPPYDSTTGGPSPADTGAGSNHNHTVNQDTYNPYYQKVIAATKDADSWTDTNPVSTVGEAMKHNAHCVILWTNIDYCYLEAATIQFFGQSSAPTGWTKKTDWMDNSMLLYTTGNISSGGSENSTTWTTAISVNSESSHTHSMQSHTHTLVGAGAIDGGPTIIITTGGPSVANTGVGSSHNHTISQDTYSPYYQKVIAATKDSGSWTDTNPIALYDPTKKGDYDTAWDNIVFNYLAATTIQFFGQSSAPTGWTKKTDWTDNSMLVYTTGSISSGGSDDPTAIWTTAISVNNESSHTHSMQSHTHTFSAGAGLLGGANFSTTTGGPSTANTGAGSNHNHTVNQDTYNPYYQKVIAATKDA